MTKPTKSFSEHHGGAVIDCAVVSSIDSERHAHGHAKEASTGRLQRRDEAEHLFERMLWLNPSDNRGIRFLLAQVRARAAWVDDED